MVVGLINGFFTAVVGINSFITTLGMLFASRGLHADHLHAQPATPGATTHRHVHVSTAHVCRRSTARSRRIFGAGTYSELIWALAIIIVLQILLTLTRWGMYTVAVGGNRLGAAEAGVKVRLVVIRNFILCSTCAGARRHARGGARQLGPARPAGANGSCFDAISAAVIGGTLLAGGSGTVVGALIGALFLGILHDGLIIKGVNANYLSFYPGPGDHHRDGRQHLRRTRAKGVWRWLSTGITGEHIVAPTAAADDVLRVEHIAKRFGPVTALRDINLHLRKGEVLGLLGDNGAGKSTLIKIICGFQKPDGGRMFLHGEPLRAAAASTDARSLGIDTVYQDLALDRRAVGLPQHVPAARAGPQPAAVPGQPHDAQRDARRRSTTSASTSRASTSRSRACPAASARRSRSRGP